MPTHTATISEPRCGRCGYIVRGLPGLTCPECGSDLREVGIRVGRKRVGSGVLVLSLAIIWGLGLWGVAAVVSEGVQRALPQWTRIRLSCLWQRPASKAYLDVTAYADTVVNMDRLPPALPITRHTLRLLTNATTVSELYLDYKSNTYRIDGGPPVSVNGQLGSQAIAAWMRNAGIDTTGAPVSAEIAAIAGWLAMPQPAQQHGSGNWSETSSTSDHVFGRTADAIGGQHIASAWPEPVAALLAVAAWLLGLRWLARRFGPRT